MSEWVIGILLVKCEFIIIQAYCIIPNILYIILIANGARAWIGLTDQMIENSFQWTDGLPVTYTNWNVKEPNNVHNEDCVMMITKVRNAHTKSQFQK